MTRALAFTLALVAAACTSTPSTSTSPPAERASPSAISLPVPTNPVPPPVLAPVQDADGSTYYQSGWDISRGWPGEYPPGFSILADGVVLPGRTVMDPSSEPNVACPVPKLATYQPWNLKRNDADDLRFVTATRMVDITMTTNAPIEVPSNVQGEESGLSFRLLDLKKGDILTYKHYLAEGYAIIAVNGEDHEISESELSLVSNIDEVLAANGVVEDLWVQVQCYDPARSRAWVFYIETFQPDIGPAPMSAYGDAADLFEEDVARVREEMAAWVDDGEF